MKIEQRLPRVKRNYLHKAIVIFSVLVFIPFFMHPNIFINFLPFQPLVYTEPEFHLTLPSKIRIFS